MRMFQFVPKTETRFWRLFRCLLLPVGIITFVGSLVCGVAAASGESAVFYGGQPVTGFAGLILSFGYWPFEIVGFSLLVAVILFVDRSFKRWRQR
jgi:hypothetical protein